MRNVVAAIAIAVVLVVVAGTPAGASVDSLSATFHGKSMFEFSGCPFAHQTFSARYNDHAGQSGKFLLAGCSQLGSPNTFSGKFRVVPDTGGIMKGTVSGTISDTAQTCADPSAVPEALDFTMVPTAGNAIHLVGLWCSPAVPGVPGPIKGTITQP